MRHDYRMVDVFSTTPSKGNPVAVIHGADDLSTEQMQLITRWMNLSETTFLLDTQNPAADYRVRIFTLDRELPFAGHPTLGSCRAWLSDGGRPRTPGQVVQECEAGLITIREKNDELAFAAPPLLRTGKPEPEKIEEVCRFLDIPRERMLDIEWIDNGPGWLGVRLDSAQAVLDVQAATRHPQRIEVGLVGPWGNGETDFEIRALFSDQHGAILEDPVTGSLNAAVAQWLVATGQAKAPYTASQGRILGREGRIEVTAANGELWIGGNTEVIVEGKITV